MADDEDKVLEALKGDNIEQLLKALKSYHVAVSMISLVFLDVAVLIKSWLIDT